MRIFEWIQAELGTRCPCPRWWTLGQVNRGFWWTETCLKRFLRGAEFRLLFTQSESLCSGHCHCCFGVPDLDLTFKKRKGSWSWLDGVVRRVWDGLRQEESMIRIDCMERASSGLHYTKGPPYTAKDLQNCFLEILHSFQVASSVVQRSLQPGALHSPQRAPKSREVCTWRVVLLPQQLFNASVT